MGESPFLPLLPGIPILGVQRATALCTPKMGVKVSGVPG